MAIQYPDTTTLIAFHRMVFAKSVLICLMSVSINSSQLSTLYHMTALKPDAHLLTSSYRGRFWFQMQTFAAACGKEITRTLSAVKLINSSAYRPLSAYRPKVTNMPLRQLIFTLTLTLNLNLNVSLLLHKQYDFRNRK